MTIKRLSDDDAINELIEFMQKADLNYLAELYSRYCTDEAVVVTSYDGSDESEVYEDGEEIATDESRSNGPRM